MSKKEVYNVFKRSLREEKNEKMKFFLPFAAMIVLFMIPVRSRSEEVPHETVSSITVDRNDHGGLPLTTTALVNGEEFVRLYKCGDKFFVSPKKNIHCIPTLIERSRIKGVAHKVPSLQRSKSRLVTASWYGSRFHGRYMACWSKCGTENPERFDMYNPTHAAHKTLPFGTRIRLINPRNQRSIVVIIKDRGPYKKGRDIDVSYAAAKKLGFLEAGVTRLYMQRL